jgi:hypothetical protein
LIGDTPYNVDGRSKDSYPLMVPYRETTSVLNPTPTKVASQLPDIELPTSTFSSLFRGTISGTIITLLAIFLIGLTIVYFTNSIYFKKANTIALKCSGCGHLVPKNPYCAYCGERM